MNKRSSITDMHDRIIRWSRRTSTSLEVLLASIIIVGVIVFGIASIFVLLEMNWQDTETFYELIYRALVLVIGVELARTLLTHDLNAIVDLLAFVVARKMLKPEITATDIIFSVTAFVLLLIGKRLILDRIELPTLKKRPATSDHL
jgi:membrane-associated HD superfamily phosphohydrolase